MSGNLVQIAKRIRELREIAGLSVEQLASELKVSAKTYSKYENGSADIPVGFLNELARKFKVELTSLLTGGEPHLHSYCLVRKGQGLAADRRKEYKYQDLAFNFARKKAEVFLVTVDPKPQKTRLSFYSHPGQEFTYVLEGHMSVILDGHEVTLGTGDSLYFDSGIRHAMKASGGKRARFLALVL